MSATNRPTVSPAALVTLPMLFAALLVWAAAQMPFFASEAASTPAPAAAPPATGGFIDHSVLDDANRLPAEDPAPLAVAAYGA